MKYKIYASFYSDIDKGMVWLSNHAFNNRIIIKITYKKRSIYCEYLKIDDNLKKIYNQKPRIYIDTNAIVMNGWYRDKLGLKTKEEYSLTIVETNKIIGTIIANLQHPQIMVRLATQLGLIGVGLGLLSLIITIIDSIK